MYRKNHKKEIDSEKAKQIKEYQKQYRINKLGHKKKLNLYKHFMNNIFVHNRDMTSKATQYRKEHPEYYAQERIIDKERSRI